MPPDLPSAVRNPRWNCNCRAAVPLDKSQRQIFISHLSAFFEDTPLHGLILIAAPFIFALLGYFCVARLQSAKIPTIIRTGDVAASGTALTTPAKNALSIKQSVTTTHTSPALPPAAIPVALSTYVTTLDVPTTDPITAADASANSARSPPPCSPPSSAYPHPSKSQPSCWFQSASQSYQIYRTTKTLETSPETPLPIPSPPRSKSRDSQ